METALYAGKQTFSPSNYETDVVRPAQPLTMEVLERINYAVEVASEVRARLYGIRDRVFGPSPATQAGSSSLEKEPHCFSDAVGARQQALCSILGDIDALSSELNNRL